MKKKKEVKFWNDSIQEIAKLRKPVVTCCCVVCGKDFQGEEPKMCCSGRECGCMGMPIEPVVCSDECYDKLMSRNSR